MSSNTLKSIGIETGRALFRYSQLQVTSEEIAQMKQTAAAEEEKRLKLVEIYNKSKEENIQREILDEKYRKVKF